MAVTRKEQIASGKKVTPLTREELRLAGKTFAPLTEDERFEKIAYGGSKVEGEINITENGVVDVADYASANVEVPASAVVSGTKNITANGNNIDVTNYASVDVNVPTLVDDVKSITIANSTSLQIKFRCLPYKRTNEAPDNNIVTYIDNETSISANGSKTFNASAKGSAGGVMASTGVVAYMITTSNIPAGKRVEATATSGTVKIIAESNTAGEKLSAILYVDNISQFPATITLTLEDSQAVV